MVSEARSGVCQTAFNFNKGRDNTSSEKISLDLELLSTIIERLQTLCSQIVCGIGASLSSKIACVVFV